jgi:lipopolysaccharide transport system permease protein
LSYVNVQNRRPLWFPFRYMLDLGTYRHLAMNLVGSDLRARFRRSKLGILWAILQPLAFSLLIAAVWGTVFQMPNYWTYAIYVFTGMILWEYFSSIMIVAQDSLTAAEGYLRQTRIPFFIFQARTPLTSMVILMCGILGVFAMMAAVGQLPEFGPHLALIPVFLVIYLMFGLPTAIIMSIMGTAFRDLKYITQIVVQGLFFISPVMLERSMLEAPELRWLHYVNPMMPLFDMFRAPLLHNELWQASDVWTVAAWIAAMWIGAILLAARSGRALVFAL